MKNNIPAPCSGIRDLLIYCPFVFSVINDISQPLTGWVSLSISGVG